MNKQMSTLYQQLSGQLIPIDKGLWLFCMLICIILKINTTNGNLIHDSANFFKRGQGNSNTRGKSNLAKLRVISRPWMVINFTKHPHEVNARTFVRSIGMFLNDLDSISTNNADSCLDQKCAHTDDKLFNRWMHLMNAPDGCI